MGKKLKLISPIPPSVNHYLGYRGIIKNGKPMAVSYKTSDAVKYQKMFSDYVVKEVKNQNWELSDNKFQHYYMDCTFYFPRTDMDCNNYWKCLADSITDTGVVWIDDTQLCERVDRIYYESKNPRIEIEIKPVEYIGIFDDISQYESFISHCIGCKRYKRNCSILANAVNGKIQEETTNCVCSKLKNMEEE